MGLLLLRPGPKWVIQVYLALPMLAAAYGLSRGRRDGAILAVLMNLIMLLLSVDAVFDLLGGNVNVGGLAGFAACGYVIGAVLYNWRTLRSGVNS